MHFHLCSSVTATVSFTECKASELLSPDRHTFVVSSLTTYHWSQWTKEAMP